MLQRWQANDEWWSMLREAEAGDILYGQGWLSPNGDGIPAGAFPVAYQFDGSGQSRLNGITPGEQTASIPGFQKATLDDVRTGRWNTPTDQVLMDWRGVVRLGDDPVTTAQMVYSRYQGTLSAHPVSRWISQSAHEIAFYLSHKFWSAVSLLPFPGLSWAISRFRLKSQTANALVDQLDLETGDVHITVGPVEFNAQPGPDGGYGLEH